MPFTDINHLEQIDVNTQTNEWGYTQNRSLIRMDQALDGVFSFTVNGDRNIVYSNGTDDEAHNAMLDISGGAGGSVIFQDTQAQYVVRNRSAGNVNFRTSVGSNTVVQPGATTVIMVHPTAGVTQVSPDGSDLTAILLGITADAHAYTDAAAFDSASAELPGQSGNAGAALFTNGSNALWKKPGIDDIVGLSAQISSLESYALSMAIVF